MLFSTPGMASAISGVIFYDETLRQKTAGGVPFPEYLTKLGIIPGIKVDTGAKPLANFPGETITEGLDGLRERLVEYHKLGARFAKWRAVIDIGQDIPSRFAIEANAHASGALCRALPGTRHRADCRTRSADGRRSFHRAFAKRSRMPSSAEVFQQLAAHKVYLEGIVLKPNMVISGKKNANRAGPQQVADATVRCLKRWVPAAVPGIAFLSGGQSTTEATLHLSLMNQQPPALGSDVQLRPRAAGFGAEGLGRQARGFRGWPEGVRETRPVERPRSPGPVQTRDGEPGQPDA